MLFGAIYPDKLLIFSRMKKLFLLIALAVGVHAVAQVTYQKVTTTPADWSGTYLIVCEGQGVIFNGAASADQIDAKGGPAILSGVTFSGGVLNATNALDSASFTISSTDDSAWPWAIQSASGLYIGHKDTVVADNGLSAETEIKNKCKHTLSIDADGNFIATPRYVEGVAFNLQYNKKSDQLRFRYFLPDDKLAIQIYKRNAPATSLDAVESAAATVKRFENGRLVILRNGKKYNAIGMGLPE